LHAPNPITALFKFLMELPTRLSISIDLAIIYTKSIH
jgi:hypothetical protein